MQQWMGQIQRKLLSDISQYTTILGEPCRRAGALRVGQSQFGVGAQRQRNEICPDAVGYVVRGTTGGRGVHGMHHMARVEPAVE